MCVGHCNNPQPSGAWGSISSQTNLINVGLCWEGSGKGTEMHRIWKPAWQALDIQGNTVTLSWPQHVRKQRVPKKKDTKSSRNHSCKQLQGVISRDPSGLWRAAGTATASMSATRRGAPSSAERGPALIPFTQLLLNPVQGEVPTLLVNCL